MSRNARIWIAAGVALVLGAGIAFGATYYILEQRQAELAAELERTPAALAQATDRVESLEESAGTTAPEVAPEPTTTPKAPTKPVAPKATRQFTFITAAKSGSSPTLVADYAQFLTGAEAAAAASARGDESPPPNDYYIVNDNRKTRTLSVAPGAKVRLVSNPDGTNDPAGYDSDFETWANYFAAPSDENAAIRQGAYWISIKSGVVVAVEEQFLP